MQLVSKLATSSNDVGLSVLYTGKVRLVVSVCTQGRGKFFITSFGLVLQQTTENICVSHHSNNRLVFNSVAKFLFGLETDKMMQPLFLATHKDRVFVTRFKGGCVLVFD